MSKTIEENNLGAMIKSVLLEVSRTFYFLKKFH